MKLQLKIDFGDTRAHRAAYAWPVEHIAKALRDVADEVQKLQPRTSASYQELSGGILAPDGKCVGEWKLVSGTSGFQA